MPSPKLFEAPVEARIEELRPAHEEYLALLDFQKTLGHASPGNGRRRGPRPGRPAASTARRRGRPPKAGKPRAE
jgi:hypothetical protein